MTVRLTQIIVRLVALALVSMATWLGSHADETKVTEVAEVLVAAGAAAGAFALDLWMHRLQSKKGP